jgi:hypothetical protein
LQTLRLTLESWSRDRHELNMCFAVGGRSIAKRYVYRDVDLIDLERRYGREFVERVYFHLMAFEAIPLASARPDSIAFGRLARFQTPEFATLWRAVFLNTSAQWRYENNLPDYEIAESIIAFALCRRQGLRGTFADACAGELPSGAEVLEHYLTVHRTLPTIPSEIAGGVYEQMERGVERARRHLDRLF